MAEQRTRREVELQLIEKAWKDDAFRQALLRDPREAVESELGGKLPPRVQVKVLEESADTFYLVLPANPDRAPAGALTDQQLDAVAGGGWGYTGGGDTCQSSGIDACSACASPPC
jgi:hypothetical protein